VDIKILIKVDLATKVEIVSKVKAGKRDLIQTFQAFHLFIQEVGNLVLLSKPKNSLLLNLALQAKFYQRQQISFK